VTTDLHKLSAGRADYYTHEIAKNREEYLSGHGESPGEHLGGSAAALGLAGTCSAEAFKDLFAWCHPGTGEQLGRPPRTDAMPAWDLVFRPTKSVSVLYGLGDEQTGAAVLAAHKHAVRQAVAYLDQQVGTRRGRHGTEHVRGSGLLATGFVHRTSRAGDPLLHTHLIIHNRTRGEDGQWRTLDSRDLLNHRAAADAVYRAAYQQELSRTLGVRWTQADRWGNRELVGMPEQVLRAFSKRHEQITAELARLEREEGKPRTARLVQLAVHATRQPKQHETPETLYGRWQDEARTLGVERERLVRDVTGPVQIRTRDHAGTGVDAGRDTRGRDAGQDRRGRDAGQDTARLSERTVRQLFDHLAGPQGSTEQASTFAHRDVLTALGVRLPAELAGKVSPDELAHLADRFLTERATSVMPEHAAGEHHYATAELLSIERRLIEAGVGLAGEQTAVCSHDSLRAALAANSTIGDDQAAMVRDITQGGAGVAVVVGKPGTGTTYALGVARHAWQLEGYRVVGTAPTGIAAVCLGAEGFEGTSTVDRLLMELDQERATRRARDGRSGRRPAGGPARQRDGRGERQALLSLDGTHDGPLLDRRTVLVVDEAAMLGSRKLDRVLDHAQHAQAKVVLVGDDRQLASIEAGGGFRGLRLRLGASTLSVNRRQRDTWQRKAAEDARSGDVDAAIGAWREHGRMVSTETPTQAKQAMLGDWWPLFQQSLQTLASRSRS
jgi:conjugative relaxase-like TrwC/TraI family protein